MNKLFTLILSLFLIGSLKAQITVGNNHFPVAGDTWYIAQDSFPDTFMTPGGPSYFWDYSNVQASQNIAFTVQDISSSAFASDFPEADVVIPFLDGEGFYKVNNDSVELVGYFGTPSAALGNLPLLIEMDPIGTLLYADMEYGDTFFDTSAFSLEIDAMEIPPEANLPFDVSDIDSARIAVTIQQFDTVDAWGLCRTPLGDFDVLRVKETQIRFTQVIVKHNFLGWFDITVFPIEGIGLEEYTNYRFIDANSKEPIIYAETRDGSINPYFMQWKIDPVSVSIEETNPINSLMAFPNPAVDQINIAIETEASGEFGLRIMNVLGREVHFESFFANPRNELQVDLNGFGAGIYLYSILDERGEILETKRFVISRP